MQTTESVEEEAFPGMALYGSILAKTKKNRTSLPATAAFPIICMWNAAAES